MFLRTMVLPQNVRSAITMWASPKPYNTLFARSRAISDANKTQIETRVESRNLYFEKISSCLANNTSQWTILILTNNWKGLVNHMQNFHFFNGVSLTSTKVPRTGSARSERFGAEKIRANICLPLSKAEAERISLKKVRAILLWKFFFSSPR